MCPEVFFYILGKIIEISSGHIMEIIIFHKKKIYRNQEVKKIDYLQVRMTSNFSSAALTAKRKDSNVPISLVLWVRVCNPHFFFKKNFLKMFSLKLSE